MISKMKTPNANSQYIEYFNTQSETKDLILDPPMEVGSSKNFEKDVGQISVPEQLVMGENEASENAELGGEDDPIMHVGGEIAPGELIEFDNNLVDVKKSPRGN